MAEAEQDDVVKLDGSNFATIVNPAPLILVKFMAPWCGHCKALKPEYHHAATELKEHSIPLGVVDCTADADLCSTHEIQGYPTLKVFSHGKASEYGGTRKADGIVTFMKKRSLPVISIVTSGNHTDFTQSDNVVIVAYLDESDKKSYETFQRYAETKRDEFIFGAVHEHSKIDSVSSLPKPSIVLWKKFDEGRNDFHGQEFTDENVSKFVSENSIPLLNEVSPKNFAMYEAAGIPLAYLFIEPNNPEREALIKALEPVAKEFKGKISFVWIDANQFSDHGKTLGLSATNWPAFTIQDLGKQTKYPFDEKKAIDQNSIMNFVKSFVDGKLSPSLKSQPIPQKQGPGSHVLVSDSFDDVVFGDDSRRDVFIKFYAPWCGHCKRLKPIWDNLAASFNQSSTDVVITKFDATENDIPPTAEISVSGYPTLKFKAAGQKGFIDYEGDRSLDSLIAFVEEHSNNKVKATKVELSEEEFEYGTGGEQVVFDKEEADASGDLDDEGVGGDEDKDAEHDEL
ncbi:thioredoxin-like domain-containing protein [Phakopsora pachyrhizi]|nr:thioredoxin-like domain-containing protein [Phakopsora pachyrhizi]